MRKYWRVYAIICFVLLLVGCKDISVESNMDSDVDDGMSYEDALDSNISISQQDMSNQTDSKDNISDSVDIKIGMYDQLDDIYNFKGKDDIRILKLSSSKYLIGYLEEYGHNLNYSYSIYDKLNQSIIELQYETFYGMVIDDIYIEDETFRLYSDGKNVLNAFLHFPSYAIFNIESGIEVDQEPYYFELGSQWRPRYVGNILNEAELVEISVEGNSILFEFGATDNTVMAGGMICPQISSESRTQNTVCIGINKLIYDSSVFDVLYTNEFIREVTVEDVNDGYGEKVTYILVEFEGVKKYYGELVVGESGYMDLVISFE